MTDKIKMKLVTNPNLFGLANNCIVCGQCKEIACEGEDQSIADEVYDNSLYICEDCLEWADINRNPKADIDWHLEARAIGLEKFAASVRSLKGRLELPTYAEWQQSESGQRATAEREAVEAEWCANEAKRVAAGRSALQRLRERSGAG